jgi:hypothetical protein
MSAKSRLKTMNVRCRQPLRIELMPDEQRPARAGRAARRIGYLVGLFGFCCFMPYAAIPIGHNSAIQIGNLLTLLLVLPIVAVPWRRQPFWIYPALLSAMVISTTKVALSGEGELELCFKVMTFWGLSLLTLLPTQFYSEEYSLELLTGIAVAAIVHTAMGIWQWRAFSQGYFPLAGFFSNQSFLSVKENADTIAKYTQRPFGIFPEPSAMSASLAPWVLLWIAEFFGIIRLRRTPAMWQRALFGIAATGGLGLIILSRSGHAMITLAAVVVLAMLWFARCRATLRNFLAIVSVCWIALPAVLALAAIAISDRLGGGKMGNSSWEDRSESLLIGFQLFTGGGLLTLLFGVGVGQTAPVLQRVYGLEAIWSITLVYLYESGLVAFAVMVAIGRYLFRVWRSSRFDFVFAAILVVWLVGVTITTSYGQLLSLWVTLGFLTVWPRVCASTEPQRIPSAPAVIEEPLLRRARWSDRLASGGGSQ